MLSIAEWTDRALALSSPMKLTSSASFSPSIRISLRLKIHQAQAKNFCRVLDIRVVLAMEAIMEPSSLYDPAYSDGRENICLIDQVQDKTSESDWLDEMLLRQALEALSAREKKILSLRFFAGKTQVEVSQAVGISQAQVSRIEKGALQRIKTQM